MGSWGKGGSSLWIRRSVDNTVPNFSRALYWAPVFWPRGFWGLFRRVILREGQICERPLREEDISPLLQKVCCFHCVGRRLFLERVCAQESGVLKPLCFVLPVVVFPPGGSYSSTERGQAFYRCRGIHSAETGVHVEKKKIVGTTRF